MKQRTANQEQYIQFKTDLSICNMNRINHSEDLRVTVTRNNDENKEIEMRLNKGSEVIDLLIKC